MTPRIKILASPTSMTLHILAQTYLSWSYFSLRFTMLQGKLAMHQTFFSLPSAWNAFSHTHL